MGTFNAAVNHSIGSGVTRSGREFECSGGSMG
jgi:hypothetical protein